MWAVGIGLAVGLVVAGYFAFRGRGDAGLSAPREQTIIGAWRSTSRFDNRGNPDFMMFDRSGQTSAGFLHEPSGDVGEFIVGTYRLLSGDEVETYGMRAEGARSVLKIRLTDDTLVMTNDKGITTKYVRHTHSFRVFTAREWVLRHSDIGRP